MRTHDHVMRFIAAGILIAAPVTGSTASYIKFDFPGATITEAFGVNDHKWIAGSFCKDGDQGSTCSAPGFSPSHGYVAKLKKSTLTFVEINFPGAFETEATSINNSGLVVGLYDAAHNAPGVDVGHAYYCQYPCDKASSFHSYDYPGTAGKGSTDFYAVNNRGKIVGNYALTSIGQIVDHGFMLDRKGRTCTIDVPGAGASDTNTLGLSDENDVVGSYSDEATGRVRAYILMDAEIKTNGAPCKGTYVTFDYPITGVLQTEASGINEDGVVVGNYLDSAQVSHAFRRAPDGTFKTIDVPQASPSDNAASSINEDNVIVGNFTELPSNKERAFVRRVH